MFSARLDTAGYRKWFSKAQAEFDRETQRALDTASNAVRLNAITRFKSHTGELARSTVVRKVNQHARNIEATAPHAGFVENGTRPHDIQPHGKALRFVANGQVMFRRTVHHPGTKATHFLRDAAQSMRPLFQQLVFEAVNKAWR